MWPAWSRTGAFESGALNRGRTSGEHRVQVVPPARGPPPQGRRRSGERKRRRERKEDRAQGFHPRKSEPAGADAHVTAAGIHVNLHLEITAAVALHLLALHDRRRIGEGARDFAAAHIGA